jgi:uncharacterized NAD-dependent epimerase/dehydratase family protein
MIPSPFLLFLGAARSRLEVKSATGVAFWRPESCIGQFRSATCGVDLGLPDLDPHAASEAGARSMVIGGANEGGYIDRDWMPSIRAAIAAGLDVVSGLHERLADDEELVALAAEHGVVLHDIRRPPPGLRIATGRPRSGRRLLTVGTDCVVGKMFAALALEREMRARGWNADFRATGQTGILIAGSGVAVDAVPADFLSGAIESLAPAQPDDHWDLIEGQGSLHHPLYAGVTLGLIHGAQPQARVLCHEAGRENLDGMPDYPIPSMRDAIASNERAARLTSPTARVTGLCINTSSLGPAAASRYLSDLEQDLQLPAVDPVRGGVAALVDALESA